MCALPDLLICRATLMKACAERKEKEKEKKSYTVRRHNGSL